MSAWSLASVGEMTGFDVAARRASSISSPVGHEWERGKASDLQDQDTRIPIRVALS